MKKDYLKPLKEKLKKKNVYGFDIETTSDKNDFLMGSIIGNGMKEIFFDKYGMIEFIIKHKPLRRNSYIVATNLGFDILGLLEETEYMEKADFLLRGGKIIIANLKDGIKYYRMKNGDLKESHRYKITFLDTMNYVPYSVKKLGEIIGVNKLPYPECLKRKEAPKNNEEKLELIRYNIRDSEISKGFFEFLQDTYHHMGTNIKPTIASTCMNLYRSKYMKDWWLQPPKEIIEETYNAYYGGRTEVFRRGLVDCRWYYYDVNNLYGGAMLNLYPLPSSLITKQKHKLSEKKKIINDYDGISYVKLQYDKNDFVPLLPMRNDDGKLLFCNGKVHGYYTHIELRKAFEIGYKIVDIGRQIYYKRRFYPFKEYIMENYKNKLKCHIEKSPMEFVWKLNNNGLYGKWGQKIHGKQRIIHMNNLTMKMMNQYIDKGYKIEQVDNFMYVTDMNAEKYPRFINPIMSIYTTGYARLKMYEYFEKYKDHIYYTDTDSMITDKPMRTSDKIGKMKLEYRGNTAMIVKPKMYALICDNGYEVVRSKGLSKIDTYDEFIDLLKTRKRSMKKFVKFKESLRSKPDGKHGKLKFNQVINIEKHIDLEDTKRQWNKRFNPNTLQISKPFTN